MFDFLFQDRNISTHILTKRMTVHPLLSVQLRQYFNSHPHEEDDYVKTCNLRTLTHFNSHPHEEDDLLLAWNIHTQSISTHILTKRMTAFLLLLHMNMNISTHILTKRMTIFFMAIAQIGIFQLTSSRRGWPKCWPIHIKWITFQLTSSRRGWPNRKQSSFASKNFNSHPHEEDDLLQHFFRLPTISFQLTSSRRGWQVCIVLLSLPGHFNSHPHEEDDEDMVNMWIWITSISTHILTKRMTVYHAFWIPRCIFQLTSSRRGWLLNPYYQALGINISTHILTKRMTDSLFCQDFFVFYFNSHPHEEDDKNRKFYERGLVSFQLTSSRRGWRDFHSYDELFTGYFNSHPHEEDDGYYVIIGTT